MIKLINILYFKDFSFFLDEHWKVYNIIIIFDKRDEYVHNNNKYVFIF